MKPCPPHLFVADRESELSACLKCGVRSRAAHYSGEWWRPHDDMPGEELRAARVIKSGGEYYVVDHENNVTAGPYIELGEAYMAHDAIRDGNEPSPPTGRKLI